MRTLIAFMLLGVSFQTACFPTAPECVDDSQCSASTTACMEMVCIAQECVEQPVSGLCGTDAETHSDALDGEALSDGDDGETVADVVGDVEVDGGDSVEVETTVDAETIDGEVLAPECDGPEDCVHLSAACTKGSCDDGTCVATPLDEGQCDDGLACTTGDRCADGACAGTAIECVALDVCHAAGECNPETGECSNPPVTGASVTCNDGLACTTDDECSAGACAGTAVVCAALDQCHDAGTCEPATGLCTQPSKSNTAECNDGLKCTTDDRCTAGECGGTPIECEALDQCHDVGECNPNTGLCSNPEKLDSTPCDDDLKCTLSDHCSAGVCNGVALVCSPTNACRVAECDPTIGGCVETAAFEGDDCDDADNCTLGDTCSAGVCAAGGPPDDAVGDWVVSAEAVGANVSAAGVATIDTDIIVAYNVDGPVTLRLKSHGTSDVTVNVPPQAQSYIVIARYSTLGRVVWAVPVIWSQETTNGSFVAVRGGPFVHGTNAITIGFAAQGSYSVAAPVPGAFLGTDAPTAVGAIRMTAAGVPVWVAHVQGLFPEFGDVEFPFVCASPNGRVGLISLDVIETPPAISRGIHGTNVSSVDLAADLSSSGLFTVMATLTPAGSLVDYAVSKSMGDNVVTACAIDDAGVFVAAGLGEDKTVTVSNSLAGPSLSRTFTFADQRFGWVVAFDAMLRPTALAGLGSATAGNISGINFMTFTSDGSLLVAALSGARISMLSSIDGSTRTIANDLIQQGGDPRAAILSVDRDLRLISGFRVDGSDDTSIQTLSSRGNAVVASGCAKHLVWGDFSYADDTRNYYVASMSSGALSPAWGTPLAPTSSAVSGDFAEEMFAIESVSAVGGANGEVFAVGTLKQTAEIGWSDPTVITVSTRRVAFVTLLNSAGEVACE